MFRQPIAVPEGQEHDRQACKSDHRHHGGTQLQKHSLDQPELAVPVIREGQRQNDNTGRQHVPDRRDDRAGNTADLQADEGRRIDRNRARCHLGNRDDVRKLGHRQPGMHFDDLMLDQRHCGVSAPDAEKADLEKAPEKLPVNHRPPSLSRCRVLRVCFSLDSFSFLSRSP